MIDKIKTSSSTLAEILRDSSKKTEREAEKPSQPTADDRNKADTPPVSDPKATNKRKRPRA
ncbi:hypothetical protein SAMD00023353_5900460 [Rosellinia necatrix]|uniref:Uncharacterized protein n=1 Tax=Rosellinia necatrix TaxID=77044 RepID=A0A1S8AA75_ROSNE|nr:hypothetical protein SAMD00023353_5900460 [Rosellinia necatrix]